jgi:hypothetical protein
MDVKDIHFDPVHVERHINGVLYLNGLSVKTTHRYPDGTIELATQAPDAPERELKYHFHGYQFWEMLHDEEPPSGEYAGQLEAQLVMIRQTCNAQDEDQPRSYSIGATIERSDETI